MFNKYYTENHKTTNNTTNIFNIPDEYIIHHRNQNDDIDRLKYYIENASAVDSCAIWLDVLYPITKKIKDSVTNYIMRDYKGEEHTLTISVSEPQFVTALSIPKTRDSMSVISNSIRTQFNMNNYIMVNTDIFNGDFKIVIRLLGRIE
ncbi:hypothetical protein [Lacrimispora sp.]|uniref:hypothetical protein n=1 Tax=Lacrimispora sp. TaxID=2719234 RepID=UPI0028AC51D8|nr:hypothetical protein [Lacrimispora sp.]